MSSRSDDPAHRRSDAPRGTTRGVDIFSCVKPVRPAAPSLAQPADHFPWRFVTPAVVGTPRAISRVDFARERPARAATSRLLPAPRPPEPQAPPREPIPRPTEPEVLFPSLDRLRRLTQRLPGSPNRMGCWSITGPEGMQREKGNEDCAFAIEVQSIDGPTWIAHGVADGVSQSPFGDRGATEAVRAFYSVAKDRFGARGPVDVNVDDQAWRQAFANAFTQELFGRFDRLEARLLEAGTVPSQWDPATYRKVYIERTDAAERRRNDWFQTTLLGVIQAPNVCMALLLGDGVLKVVRDAEEKNLVVEELTERFMVRRHLDVGEVEASIIHIPVNDAKRIYIAVASDGVEKSKDHGDFFKSRLAGDEDCQQFLERLARRPADEVEFDNMSVAFADLGVPG